eukprot:TRINITY_DN55581_c0_g1_i1.p1 TRINITY_DN55581_c0_g1~~TRINITY_DN55581_c0_g1_i1.p1  ORF type:complete len:705 (-),score=97.49 TRINITY_DN55581_c0_g1_i1:1096-3210(-)
MDFQKPPFPNDTRDITDVVVKLMNFTLLLFHPRKVTNVRWANTKRDAPCFKDQFSEGQFTDIYQRITSKYKFHRQQQFHNAARKFDVTEPLRHEMHQAGNVSFYRALLDNNNMTKVANHDADLTRIQDLNTATTSADYLHREVLSRKHEKAAQAARRSYVRGFSRVVHVTDYEDWKSFRQELRNGVHKGAGLEESPDDNVLLVSLSYKGNTVKITRRMRLVKEDGTPEDDDGILAQTELQMTSDFVDDFRWSQVIRSCRAIAKREGIYQVRIWIDRLVMMGLSREERAEVYKIVDWEDFGLFAYAICPVIRVYDAQEPYYGTDFWRKLETVLGVAGRGVVVDDYMLRKYDHTIFFGDSMYTRFDDGVSRIGGNGIYLRSVTLALATAVLTDGVTVSAANEDLRTIRAASAWKAWALRTIAEGAYSASHSSMLRQEEKFILSFGEFMTIAFWESMVTQCPKLCGRSYLDMSFQRSMMWRKSSNWDGILEWVGMIPDSCEIREREDIMRFLKENARLSTWVATTGHVASIITLRSPDWRQKRCLVVELARYSTVGQGQVVAVAEATGLWEGSILPSYLRFKPDADSDQKAVIGENGVEYAYENMQVTFSCLPKFLTKLPLLVLNLALFGVGSFALLWLSRFFIVLGILLLIAAVIAYFFQKPWPWVDQCDVGEAVFDNLLLHSLYASGIKNQYRSLKGEFAEIGWN